MNWFFYPGGLKPTPINGYDKRNPLKSVNDLPLDKASLGLLRSDKRYG